MGEGLRAIWLEETGQLYRLALAGRGDGRVRLIVKVPSLATPTRAAPT